jgi:hypothetical protein
MSSAQFEQLRSQQFQFLVRLLLGPLELAQLQLVMLQVMQLV